MNPQSLYMADWFMSTSSEDEMVIFWWTRRSTVNIQFPSPTRFENSYTDMNNDIPILVQASKQNESVTQLSFRDGSTPPTISTQCALCAPSHRDF
jgi:hypothetical protein